MVRYFSTLMPSDWLYFSIILILLPKIESTPCGEVIHLDSDQPNAEIIDEQYRLREIDDNNAINSAGEECLWYFRGPPGSTIRLDIVSTTSEPLIIYDGLGVKTDVDQGIQLGGRNGNMFISSNHGVTCKLPKPSDETQEPTITLQATLQVMFEPCSFSSPNNDGSIDVVFSTSQKQNCSI
nr:uncharacterized protein LOC129253629 [Lytechinus pictus]